MNSLARWLLQVVYARNWHLPSLCGAVIQRCLLQQLPIFTQLLRFQLSLKFQVRYAFSWVTVHMKVRMRDFTKRGQAFKVNPQADAWDINSDRWVPVLFPALGVFSMFHPGFAMQTLELHRRCPSRHRGIWSPFKHYAYVKQLEIKAGIWN